MVVLTLRSCFFELLIWCGKRIQKIEEFEFPQTVYCWGSIFGKKELATLTGRAGEPCVFLLLLVATFSNPVGPPGVPRCPRATVAKTVSFFCCLSRSACPACPRCGGRFITVLLGACTLLCGYTCNSDTVIEKK